MHAAIKAGANKAWVQGRRLTSLKVLPRQVGVALTSRNVVQRLEERRRAACRAAWVMAQLGR